MAKRKFFSKKSEITFDFGIFVSTKNIRRIYLPFLLLATFPPVTFFFCFQREVQNIYQSNSQPSIAAIQCDERYIICFDMLEKNFHKTRFLAISSYCCHPFNGLRKVWNYRWTSYALDALQFPMVFYYIKHMVYSFTGT